MNTKKDIFQKHKYQNPKPRNPMNSQHTGNLLKNQKSSAAYFKDVKTEEAKEKMKTTFKNNNKSNNETTTATTTTAPTTTTTATRTTTAATTFKTRIIRMVILPIEFINCTTRYL